MAQQQGSVRFRGKFANMVGYKNTASSQSNNSFVRERVYNISNPRTYAQATQRSKSRPAQLFYAAFEPVLNHAFLPKAKPSLNRNRFMSYAMHTTEISDVEKGQAFIPAVPYRISYGSLGLDSLCKPDTVLTQVGSLESDGLVQFPNFALTQVTEPAIQNNLTVGAFSENVLNNNPAIVEGEEITVLAVACRADAPYERLALRCSIVLNAGDTVTKVSDVTSPLLALFSQGGRLIVGTVQSNYKLLTAGVIISSKTAKSWDYTNSWMGKSAYAIDGFDYDPEKVIGSYMVANSALDSDLILQQADNDMSSSTVQVATIDMVDFTLAEGVEGTPSQTTAAVAVFTDGSRKVIVTGGSAILQNYAGGKFTSVTIESGSPAVIGGLAMGSTSLAGNPTILVSQLTKAGFQVGAV